jgi:hypothetical protein
LPTPLREEWNPCRLESRRDFYLALFIRVYPSPSVVEKFMPTALIHRIGIAAPAETTYRVITTILCPQISSAVGATSL